MRGPGPKWHAKHTASLVAAAGVQPLTAQDVPRGRSGSAQHAVKTWLASTAAAAGLGFVAVMMLA